MTVAALQALGAPFATADVGVLEGALTFAGSLVSRKAWGSKADSGVLYLAAHEALCELQPDDLRMTSKKVGPLSVTYADATERPLTATRWGRKYLALRRTVFASRC